MEKVSYIKDIQASCNLAAVWVTTEEKFTMVLFIRSAQTTYALIHL